MYVLDPGSGELVEFENKAKYTVGLFLYGPNADISKIEGQCPLVYKDRESCVRDISSPRILGFLRDN